MSTIPVEISITFADGRMLLADLLAHVVACGPHDVQTAQIDADDLREALKEYNVSDSTVARRTDLINFALEGDDYSTEWGDEEDQDDSEDQIVELTMLVQPEAVKRLMSLRNDIAPSSPVRFDGTDYQVWLVVPRDREGKPRGVEKAAAGQMFYTEAEADTRRDAMNANMLSNVYVTVPALVIIGMPEPDPIEYLRQMRRESEAAAAQARVAIDDTRRFLESRRPD